MPMERATLAGISGYGELKVVRSAEDHVEEIAGLWRLADEAADADALQDLRQRSEGLSYRGPITDPLYPDVREAELEVNVTGIETYTYDDGDGATRDVVRLKASGPLGYEGTARRAERAEEPVIDES
ncbi:MAG: hypothetical protein M3498_02070 [Deinococcota bacterium]|nr:hypothetical protein [Deinococcota bacterium]